MGIAGGVALLLWGTRMVRTGVMRAYGAELRRVLGRSTRGKASAAAMGLAGQRIAMEVNEEIVPKSGYPSHQFSAGDRIEIVHAVGGG